LTAVVLVTIPTAVVGIEQFPLAPRTWNVTDSFGPIGVARVPTTSLARVSTSRQGVIGTNDDSAALPAAPTCRARPPATIAPAATARIVARAIGVE
jgi:hypothetical protein